MIWNAHAGSIGAGATADTEAAAASHTAVSVRNIPLPTKIKNNNKKRRVDQLTDDHVNLGRELPRVRPDVMKFRIFNKGSIKSYPRLNQCRAGQ